MTKKILLKAGILEAESFVKDDADVVFVPIPREVGVRNVMSGDVPWARGPEVLLMRFDRSTRRQGDLDVFLLSGLQ